MAGLLYLMAFEYAPRLGATQMSEFTGHHVTVLGSFALPDRNVGIFTRTLRAMTAWFTPITVQLDHHEVFGTVERPIPVAVVTEVTTPDQPHQQLRQLHESCLQLCHELGGVEGDLRFVGVNYKPHITGWQAEPGSRVVFPVLTLVEHKGGFGIDVHTVATFQLDG